MAIIPPRQQVTQVPGWHRDAPPHSLRLRSAVARPTSCAHCGARFAIVSSDHSCSALRRPTKTSEGPGSREPGCDCFASAIPPRVLHPLRP
jgi:hypothetical protein